LRKLINLVPQESFLFPLSVAENIAYARDLTKQQIVELAQIVAIDDEMMQLPSGFESVVGERGVTLSGGQRQRLTIARALAINPEILILDEALSNLDAATGEAILSNIEHYRKGKTTILITHKLQFAKSADMVWVMDKGQIVEVGSHLTLLAKEDSLYSALWRSVNDGS
jgi:ATP-binding cassette, subfamily B, multidrug efflux pump